MLGLLSSKPVLYVCNVEEASADKGNAFSDRVFARAREEGAKAVVVSAKIESEIAVLDAAEQQDYLEAAGLAEPGLNRVIRAGYELLDEGANLGQLEDAAADVPVRSRDLHRHTALRAADVDYRLGGAPGRSPPRSPGRPRRSTRSSP